jgi:hypothetical protein
MTTEITTLEDFKRACEAHDLTYSYSDDGRWWRAGCESHERIVKAAEKFPREDVERIWNAVVDTKVIPDAAPQFYWSWPAPPAPPEDREPRTAAGSLD